MDGVTGRATSTSAGVRGIHFAGADEDAPGVGVLGETNVGAGVSGRAVAGTGVAGNGTTGVQGSTDAPTGIGVLAENTAGGTALRVSGGASFSRDEVLTVPAGASSYTKAGVTLASSTSYVLATLQTNVAGLHVQSAVPDRAAKTITIYLNKAAPTNVKLAYFIIDN